MTTMKRAIVIAFFAASSAFGQNSRSAVSVSGLDTNPCTVALPCRSFGAAVLVTGARGEIVALDSAGYGGFVIDREITVQGAPGVHAAISVPLNVGIDVVAQASDHVVIRNIVLLGTGGIVGIRVQSAAETRVLDCLARGFATYAIKVSAGNVTIDRTTVVDNIGTTGIDIGSDSDPNIKLYGSVTHCLIDNNYNGIAVRADTHVVMSDSTITNNSYGASAISVIGNPQIQLILAELTIENCIVASNTQGIYTFGSGGNNAGVIYLSQNVVAYNANAVQIAGHSFVSSYNNNRFVGNTVDGDPFDLTTTE
jgi:hypothetical protein